MYEQQLDLFSSASIQVDRPLPLSMELRPAATVLDDQALIAAIPDANLADGIALAAEAGSGAFSRRLILDCEAAPDHDLHQGGAAAELRSMHPPATFFTGP